MASRYARVPQAVWQDPRLSYAEFKTLVCLIGYANKDGRCWPAIATIAQELGRARSTVSGHLEALIGHGYLEKFPQRRPDGGQKANVYLLKLPPSDEPTGGCPATREPTRRVEQQSFLLPISSAAGSSDRGVSGGQRGPAGPDPAPAGPDPTPIKNRPIEQTKEHPPGGVAHAA
jgi:GntR family transcriptional regulator